MFTDPNPEVLNQLRRIADSLSRPPLSPWTDWAKTMVSFIAGLGTAFISQNMQSRTTDRREQKNMRRVIYTELAKNFCELDAIIGDRIAEDGTPLLKKARWTITNGTFLTFEGEKYIAENTAVFWRLTEGEILKWVYYWFHRLDIPRSTVPVHSV